MCYLELWTLLLLWYDTVVCCFQVRELCEAAGVALDVSSNRSLAASLEAACSVNTQAASLIKSLTTRAMSEAEYCSTGALHAVIYPCKSILHCAPATPACNILIQVLNLTNGQSRVPNPASQSMQAV